MRTARIEIGFPGDIIHKDNKLPTCSLAQLPSAIASSKLHELIEAKTQVHASASNTMVAGRLPKLPRDDRFVDRTPAEQADYPAVTVRDNAISISVKLGDIPPGEPIEVFKTPLRLCIGSDLKGRRIGIQYSLFAQNLRSAATGKLRLLF